MSGVAVLDPLEELLSRAGASYEDREAWVAERRGGITATEVRELYMRGPGYRQDLLLAKLGIYEYEANWRRAATEYGHTREPLIAAWARDRFALEPESRVFHAADERRFLASPDAVGVSFAGALRVGEFKTATEDIAPGTKEFDAKGYLFQMTWGMRVTGARECLYAWEQHDGDWQDRGGEFREPAPLHDEPRFRWISYDEALAAELEGIACGFLAELVELRERMGRGEEVVTYDDAIDTLAVNVLRFRSDESSAKTAKEKAWKELQALVADRPGFSQESPLARVTWNPGGGSVTEEVPDVPAAKAADPALFNEAMRVEKAWREHLAKFTKTEERPAKSTLTVTAAKPKKEGR